VLVAFLAVAVVALVVAASASAWGGGISSVSGTHGANFWYTSNVTVNYEFHALGVYGSSEYEFLNQVTCTSNEGSDTSGDGTSGYTFLGATLTLTQEGSEQASCAGFGHQQHQTSSTGCGFFGAFPCYSAGSFGFGAGLSTFLIDKTAPTNVLVSMPAANSYGWYNSPFTITISGDDDVSGIWDCGFGDGYGPSPVTGPSITVNSNTTASGVTANGGCRNNAGLRTYTGTQWRYDSTLPTLAPSISPSGVLLRGSAATASPGASDALSGIPAGGASCDPVDTSTVGSHTLNCSATDRAGNTQTASPSYTVGFGFTGFAQPVDNNDVLNVAKAGQTIPLVFSVSDANGPVTDLSSVSVSSNGESCDLSDPTDAIEAYAAGSSGLQNLGGGNYQFNWKTDKAFAGQCRQVNVNVGDGTTHSAQFKFTK
jgi:hypothetical protein